MMSDPETKDWLYPATQWRYFGPILHKSKSYSEFKMRCELVGYSEYSDGWCSERGIRCYDEFLMSEACGWRGKGIMNQKAAKFRDEMERLKSVKLRREISSKHGR